MSRKFETTTKKVTQTHLVETNCDLCGATAKSGDWESSTYEVNEVEVEVIVRTKQGENYPEGGSGTKIEVDLCPKCFKNILVPFLQSKGAKVEVETWDW